VRKAVVKNLMIAMVKFPGRRTAGISMMTIVLIVSHPMITMKVTRIIMTARMILMRLKRNITVTKTATRVNQNHTMSGLKLKVIMKTMTGVITRNGLKMKIGMMRKTKSSLRAYQTKIQSKREVMASIGVIMKILKTKKTLKKLNLSMIQSKIISPITNLLKFQLTTSFQWRNKGQWLKLKDLSLAS
jgi:hypothetical protein